ncbi:MAG: TolC family protein, partial [Flammeovirgaceae bacterium]
MRYILTLTLITCSFFSFGQESWSLEKCIEYALENNLSIKTNALNIQTNQEALTLAEHARYPSLNFSASHNYSWGRSIDPFSNSPITERIQSNNFSLGGSVTVYNGSQLKNSIKQSQLNIQSSEFDLEQSKNFIVLNLANAYMNILFGIENLANAQRQVQNLDEQIERTQKLVDAGVLPKNNLLDLQSQKATNELQAVQAENALAISRLNLKQLLQLPADEELQIVIPAIPDPNTNEVIPTSSAIYTTAESIQPQIKSADIQAESAELGIELAKANYLPSLNFQYSLNSGYSSAQQELFL